MKICFVSSSGGHFEQLMCLKELMNKYESFIVTEKTFYNVNIDNKNVYYLNQINRKEKFFFVNFIVNSFKSIYLFAKEKPDLIITTGVLSVIPICILAKLFKKKIIYIESFAKINSPTKTGNLIYKFADLFIVQWENLLQFYPNAIYGGGIY